MMRSWPLWIALALFAAPLQAGAQAQAQDQRRTAIDVDRYKIDARVDIERQTLQATAAVTFLPLDSGANSATFELHNALTVTKVEDDQGRRLEFNRSAQDFSVRVY